MQINTAVILAAGLGTRLMPITRAVPKPLLDIAGKPPVLRIIENMERAGLTEFFVVINQEKEQLFTDAIPARFNVKYIYQDQPTGMTDAILLTRSYIDADFVVCAGDMIVPDDHVAEVVHMQETARPFGTLSLFKAGIDYVKGMGNVQLDDEGTVTRIIEKPPPEQLLSNIYSLPFYVFDASIFGYLDACPVSSRGERELQDAIQLGIDDNKILKGVVLNREFSADETEFKRQLASLNITDVRDYFTTCMDVLAAEGMHVPMDILCTLIEPVLIRESSSISDNAMIGPNAIVGQNVSVDALSEISHAIVQDNCKIGKRCTIEYAIIMDGAVIEDDSDVRGNRSDIKIIE
ncbi:MAG TPA: NDP-sugar synthase [Candidatus Lokiarchaeia archaeon]|nr:NDP-sugar synthase [Candidatus Lokiarchaeia archaeon]